MPNSAKEMLVPKMAHQGLGQSLTDSDALHRVRGEESMQEVPKMAL